MIRPQPFSGPWRLEDLANVEKNGLKCLSTFACGGGSSMGYKLAGFDVIAALEIEKRISDCYIKNLNPANHYNMDIRLFNKQIRSNPADFEHLMNIDVLDGSPPCSQFSTSGKREQNWGKEKVYGEGKHLQTVDDLFFDFIETVDLLQPKVVVAENVTGLIKGNAKGYVKQIVAGLKAIGYDTQLFLLNSSVMGVPQKRERVIFVSNRTNQKKIKLGFNEKPIPLKAAFVNCDTEDAHWIPELSAGYWRKTAPGESFMEHDIKRHWWDWRKLNPNTPSFTLMAGSRHTHWNEPRLLSTDELAAVQTFPTDYRYDGDSTWARWVCGMSVPPFMMQRIALEIGRQWFGIEYDRATTKLKRDAILV